ERLEPCRCRAAESDLDGEIVDRLDALDGIEVGFGGHCRGVRVDDVLPGKDHVAGGEGCAVVPDDVVAQAPGNARAVFGELAVLQRGDLGSQDRDEIAVVVEVGQGKQADAGGGEVLAALGEVWVQDRRGLPVQGGQPAAATLLIVRAAFGCGRLDRCVRDGGRRRRLVGGRSVICGRVFFGWRLLDSRGGGARWHPRSVGGRRVVVIIVAAAGRQ